MNSMKSKRPLNKTRLADFTESPESYISVVELSNYVNSPGEDPKADPRVRARLLSHAAKRRLYVFLSNE